MSSVQTVMKEQEQSDKFNINGLDFEIMGLNVERSFEDRSVYIRVSDKDRAYTDWLNGEDAITLGLSLIKQGQFALKANMINHQAIHMKKRLDKYINEGRVKFIKFTVIDENPVNYGKGYRTYKIEPEWRKDKSPEYDEDFSMEYVIYWSPRDEDFIKQINNWNGDGKCLILMYGYDRSKELKEFNIELQEHCTPSKPKETWTL